MLSFGSDFCHFTICIEHIADSDYMPQSYQKCGLWSKTAFSEYSRYYLRIHHVCNTLSMNVDKPSSFCISIPYLARLCGSTFFRAKWLTGYVRWCFDHVYKTCIRCNVTSRRLFLCMVKHLSFEIQNERSCQIIANKYKYFVTHQKSPNTGNS